MSRYLVGIPEQHTFWVAVEADSPAEAQSYAAEGRWSEGVSLEYEVTQGDPADWLVELEEDA